MADNFLHNAGSRANNLCHEPLALWPSKFQSPRAKCAGAWRGGLYRASPKRTSRLTSCDADPQGKFLGTRSPTWNSTPSQLPSMPLDMARRATLTTPKSARDCFSQAPQTEACEQAHNDMRETG